MATIGEEINVDFDAITTNVVDSSTLFIDSVISVSMGETHSLAISNGGDLYATGYNVSGALGLGDSVSEKDRFTTVGIPNVACVEAGEGNSFIIKTDGSLWASGHNFDGELGIGSSGNHANAWSFKDTGQRNVRTVSAGNGHTLIIKMDGSMWAAGNNDYGQLCTGDTVNSTYFIDTGLKAIKVSASTLASHFIKADGNLWAVGSNGNGNLGVGNTTDVTTPILTGMIDVVELSADYDHTALINTSGEVWTVGKNNKGQLGLGHNTDVTSFTDTGFNASTISTGKYFSIAMTSGGALHGTGYNYSGQLGLGDNTNRDVFTDTWGVVSAIFAGGESTLVLSSILNSIYGTGSNVNGRMGLGSTNFVDTVTDSTHDSDPHIPLVWHEYDTNDTLQLDNYLYAVTCVGDSPCIFITTARIGYVNQYKPFDGSNITPAVFSSSMSYTISGEDEFNAFTLAKVLASSVTYAFTLPSGDSNYGLWLNGVEVASGGNGIVKTDTTDIDCKRDPNGVLSLYPTTIIKYADYQMPEGSTVDMTLTHTDDISLGDFTLNNSVCSTFTQLGFSHGMQDFNDYTPDPWGNIPERTKGIVSSFVITCDLYLSSYDYAISFLESIKGTFVAIDGSDIGNDSPNGETKFSSLTKRVMVTNASPAPIVIGDKLDIMAGVKLSVQEVV